MLRTLLTSIPIAACLTSSLAAQITVVEDDFESYADDIEFSLTWEPVPIENFDAGILTTDEEMFPGIEGQAVAHIGTAVNEWVSFGEFFDPLNGDDVLEPTEEHSIVFGGDLFLETSNTRLSIGLRSNEPANILELGAWNTDFRTLAYRLILFGEGDVNWQFFELPSELDTNEDGTVTPGDLGPSWHRFQATVTPTDVTFEVDVFRDGTVDARSVVEAVPHEAMFDSFRIGGPSGVLSVGEGAFDNVFLRLVAQPIIEDPFGDYNNNGLVEQADLDLVLGNWGADAGDIPEGWATGFVDQNELDLVLGNWGATGGPGLGTAGSVPEPASCVLAAACVWGLAILRRRRR